MNPFRHLLRAAGAHPPVGTWIMSASPIVAEAVGQAGFDWGVLDMEHAPTDLMDIVHMLHALSATRMVPIVRVPSGNPVMVKRVLDAGATTLMFPLVHSPQEARQAVAATRFPPAGVRGMSLMSRASRYGTVANFQRTADGSMGVIVELETPAAIDQLEGIADVPGVDALFIGPADLSAAMGHGGEAGHPAVIELMAKAAHRAKAVGKPIGAIGATPELVAQYRAAGFGFVGVGSDIGLLMRGAHAVVHSLRTPDSEHHVHSIAAGTRAER